MSTQQFDESKHRRTGDGKFTTKGFTEAADGTDADLSMDATPQPFDVQAAWEQTGIEISHPASLAAMDTMAKLAANENPEAAATAAQFAAEHIEKVTALRDKLAADPTLAATVTPDPSWRDELERLSVAQGALDVVQRYADKHQVPVQDVVADLHRDGQTIAAEMDFNIKTHGADFDPRDRRWGGGSAFYGWQHRCNDAAREVKNRSEYATTGQHRADQDIEWAKQGKVRCPRCGGVGGSKAWRDYVCYECGGAKTVEGKPAEIEAILNSPSAEQIAADLAKVKAAEAAAEEKLTAQIRQYVATDPALRTLMDMDDDALNRSQFMSDMFDRVNSGQQLTERQLAAVQRAVGANAGREQKKAAAAPVPTGKGIEIIGKVTSTKWDTDARGSMILKMRVEHEQGWAVWGTVPAKLETEVDKGSQISFTAEIAASKGDASFGFFKRPSKAKLL